MKPLITSCLFFITQILLSQNYQWVTGVGSSTVSAGGKSITYDATGNVYSTGIFAGTVDFDYGVGVYTLTAITANDLYVLKQDALGNFLWAISVSGANPVGIELDPTNNIVIAGKYSGTVDFDPTPSINNVTSVGSSGAFILKLSNSATFLWVKTFEGSGSNYPAFNGLCTDVNGNIYAGGYFFGTTDLDPNAGSYPITNITNYDCFYVKLDVGGNFQWGGLLSAPGSDAIHGLSADASGNLILVGNYDLGTLDADPSPAVYNLPWTSGGPCFVGCGDSFIIKLNASGSFVWAKNIGNQNADVAYRVTTNLANDVFVAGMFSETVDFDPNPSNTFNLSAPGANSNLNNYLLKLDGGGNFVWASVIATIPSTGFGSVFPQSLVIDNLGNVIVVGGFSANTPIDFDQGIATYTVGSFSGSGFYFHKTDASGNFISVFTSSITGTGTITDLAISPCNDIFVTGGFASNVDFDNSTASSTLSAIGTQDAFVLKLSDFSPFPANAISGILLACPGTSLNYSVVPLAGVVSYSWSAPLGSTINTGQNTNNINITVGSTSGTVSVVATNSCGSTSTATLLLTAAGSMSVSATTTSIMCAGNTATVILNTTGGTMPYTFAWQSSVSTTNTAIYSAGSYTVAIKDANNCILQQTLTLNQPLALSISSITTSSAYCSQNNGTVSFSITGGTATYTAIVTPLGSSITGSVNTITNLPTGTYTLLITDTYACTSNAVFNINSISSPTVSIITSSVNCFGNNTGIITTINPAPPTLTYTWSNGAQTTSISALSAGIFTLTIEDLTNCKITYTVEVTQPTKLNANNITSEATCANNSNGKIEIGITGGTPSYSINWNNGLQGTILNNLPSGVFTATITDAKQCDLVYTTTVEEKSCLTISIPNMFTPNSDGINDLFTINGISIYPNNTLFIYNRWGSLVYEKQNYNNEWGGKANQPVLGSGQLPAGTYFVVLDFGDGVTKSYNGFVQLIY